MPTPRLILTSGEPAGIGPDLCVALAGYRFACDLTIAGDAGVLDARARQLGIDITGKLNILHVPARAPVVAGVLDRANAGYVLALLDRALDGCVSREFDAMVTAPVQKSVINDAGIAFSGHTEYLAE